MNFSLICYFDILGFTEKINDTDSDQVEKIVGTLESVSIFLNKVKDAPIPEEGSEFKDLNVELLSKISIDIFNDSILILGDFPKESLAEKHWGKEEAFFHFLIIYLHACAYIYFQIFADLELLSRGAIVCGKYVRKDSNNFHVILSKDIVKAIHTEKNKAKYPRIILDDSFLNLVQSFSGDLRDKVSEFIFLDDTDNLVCLDILGLLLWQNNNMEIKNKIRDAILSIAKKSYAPNVQEKYDWFAKYVAEYKDILK